MRKALMNIPQDNEKIAFSEFVIEVTHKDGEKVKFTAGNYTFENIFEVIKEKYDEELNQIQKVNIEVLR